MTDLLRVTDLELRFVDPSGDQVLLLRRISLSVNAGETVAIVGESGSGKSITVKTVMRLLPSRQMRVAGGSIAYDGLDMLQLPEGELTALRGKRISLVPQHPGSSLNPLFTIGEQFFDLVAFQARRRAGLLAYLAPRASGKKRRRIEQTVADALQSVSIPNPRGVMEKYPFQISGGMAQRVLIAMALVGNPSLVIADEPTTALDVTIGQQINGLLADRVRDQQASMLYITHDLGVARQISQRVYVMYAGQVIESGSTANVFDSPLHPYTRGLIDAVPKISGGRVKGMPGTIPDLKKLGTGCPFRWRCPQVVPGCADSEPVLRPVADNHAVACHLVRETQ
ncbi:ABC transporter ATP-binding protein [Aminobacter sp. MSH1]|uniref:ABC transporter ATP-binding protein n=1 Tax=Aminobacter sp. MSH1 TaxID=374606 RepID=UPI000D3C93ED|nr:ABC transporter ATP-binding protein [Aminobacter sp. MSH1]